MLVLLTTSIFDEDFFKLEKKYLAKQKKRTKNKVYLDHLRMIGMLRLIFFLFILKLKRQYLYVQHIQECTQQSEIVNFCVNRRLNFIFFQCFIFNQQPDQIIKAMLGKYYNPKRDIKLNTISKQESPTYGYWRERRIAEQEKKQFKKKLFGQHYNHSLVGLNKEKKYMLEEQRMTQIERANRILFEKLQKIGQRGIKMHKDRRVYSQETEESQIQSKHSRIHHQKESTKSSIFGPLKHLKKTIENKTKYGQFYELNKTQQLKNTVLFHGHKQIDQKMLLITVSIDKNMYVLQSEHGNVHHKIQMDLKDYRVLLRDTLKGDHLNIFEMLKFNGTILELVGGKRQQVNIVQHEELVLPAVNRYFTPKKRTYTS